MNTTVCDAVPALGIVPGAAKANDPATLAPPPLRAAEASDSPNVIPAAVGAAVIVGVALAIVKASVFVAAKSGSVPVTVTE